MTDERSDSMMGRIFLTSPLVLSLRWGKKRYNKMGTANAKFGAPLGKRDSLRILVHTLWCSLALALGVSCTLAGMFLVTYEQNKTRVFWSRCNTHFCKTNNPSLVHAYCVLQQKKAEQSLGKLIAGTSVHLHGMTSLKSLVADSGNNRLGAGGLFFLFLDGVSRVAVWPTSW
jgi:hypothetical protein